MHMSHEEVAIDAWELRRLCGKSAKNDKKRVQNLKIFTKIYCTSGLPMLECTPLGDFDPLESTNLRVFFFSLLFYLLVNYLYIIRYWLS